MSGFNSLTIRSCFSRSPPPSYSAIKVSPSWNPENLSSILDQSQELCRLVVFIFGGGSSHSAVSAVPSVAVFLVVSLQQLAVRLATNIQHQAPSTQDTVAANMEHAGVTADPPKVDTILLHNLVMWFMLAYMCVVCVSFSQCMGFGTWRSAISCAVTSSSRVGRVWTCPCLRVRVYCVSTFR